MTTPTINAVALATGLCMSGLAFAGEADVRAHLAADASTAYLLQGDARLELMQPADRAPANTSMFQKFIGELPLHGAQVFVIENPDGTVARVFDDSTQDLTLRRGVVNVAQDAAVNIAQAALPQAIDSAAEQVWFRAGDEAVLAWEVTTTLADPGLPASPTHFEMVIDAETGSVLSERQIDTKTYAPGSPEAAAGVFPRIVINNAIGAAGSRNYAAPFDAVVNIGGCTGTLIAPNVVLSARHCGIGSGTFVAFGPNGNNPVFVTSVQSSTLPDGGGSLLDGGDVSIHVLNSSVPANIAEPMRLIDETNALEGMRCATIGYGLNGLGSSGHGFSSDGRRWGGENTIDRYGSPASAGGTNIISTDFDNGSSSNNTIPSSSSAPVEFEATTAPGDSGGPVLVQVGDEWVIAGVLSGGTSSTSRYGDISWWTGSAIYRSSIEAFGGDFDLDPPTMPPAPFALLSPADGADDLQIPLTLAWEPSTDATSYNLLVIDSDAPAAVLVTSTTGTSIELDDATLNPGTNYAWVVTAVNADGDFEADSFTFATEVDDAPVSCQDVAGDDGIVGPTDLFGLLAAFGTDDPENDFDNDGSVGPSDLFSLLAFFGQTCP